jgi:putative aldouronate transport system substrate-binding protein
MKKLALVLVILLTAITLVTTGCKKEPVQLTVELFDRGTDGGRSIANDNAWTKWVQEKVKADLNIDITFVPVARFQEHDILPTLMAAGDAPDLCYTYSGGAIAAFRDQGGVLDLAPYIDRYLPDLKKLLSSDPAFPGKDFIYRNADPQTGEIYSIPSYRVALAQRNVFIRKDWLDKLGLSVPTTPDQFYSALVAFRDNAGTLGVNRLVPYGQNSDARWGLANPIHHYIENLSDRDRWINSVHDRYITMPGYKEGVREMNRWYNDRLIFQDFPLMTTAEDFYSQIKSGIVGAFCQNWDLIYRTDSKILEELQANVPGANYIPVDCFDNKDMFDKVGLQIFIPKTAEAKGTHIAALRYLNWLAKPENYTFLQIGQEGVNHILVNGLPSIQGRPAGDDWFQNSAQNIDMTMPMNGIEMGSTELNVRVLTLGYGTTPPDVIIEAYATSVRNARVAAVFQATTIVNQYSATLQQKADALIAQAIRARPADFDRIWDEGMADWLASGGSEVIAERSSLYR